MKSFEALLSLTFLIILSFFVYSLPPPSYNFSDYAYALVNDYYNILINTGSVELPYSKLNELKELSSTCISAKRKLLVEENIMECPFKKETYSTTRCLINIAKVCYTLSIS